MFFRRNPEEAVQKAVEQLSSAVEERRTPQDVYAGMKKVLDASNKLNNDTRNNLLERLAALMEQATGPQAASIAIGSGALVEAGGDPQRAFAPILRHIPNMLHEATRFLEECIARHKKNSAPPPGQEDTEEDANALAMDNEGIVEEYGAEIAEEMPLEAAAWMTLQPLCLGAIAMLSRSRAVRRMAREHATLLPRLEAMPFVQGSVSFLKQMLQVLDDEELLVLHPTLRRGYRVRISGIADNFQLHTLLADALIGDEAAGLLPGPRLDPQVVAVARNQSVTPRTPAAEGRFNLWTWQGLPYLQAGDTTTETPELLNQMSGSEHWVWNEGVPADIPHFEGRRVVLLGPPPYPRAWNAGRIFDGMEAELTVLEILHESAVNDWLQRLKSGQS